MACLLEPTGPPTLETDLEPHGIVDIYSTPKTETLDMLIPYYIEAKSQTKRKGTLVYFRIEWQVDPLILDQDVTLLYRLETESVFTIPRTITRYDIGTIYKSGLDWGATYDFWIRRENATEFSPWYHGKIVLTEDVMWYPDYMNFVYRNTILVEVGGSPVFYYNP